MVKGLSGTSRMKGIRGGIKNCFLLSFKKGGGAKNTQSFDLFLHQFLTNFDQFFFIKGEGGGGLAQSKNSLSEKLRWTKKGRGWGLTFFTKSKKKVFYASPKRAEESKGTEEAEGPEDTL